MKKTGLFWVAMCVVAAVVTACGGSDSAATSSTATSSSATSAEAAPAMTGPEAATADGPTITIDAMSFGDPITVASGAVVQVVNNDGPEHSVTSDEEGLFDVEADGGESTTLTAPSEPGEYTFYCRYHPNMKGTLIVQ